jgi:hypothetical protein
MDFQVNEKGVLLATRVPTFFGPLFAKNDRVHHRIGFVPAATLSEHVCAYLSIDFISSLG